MIKHQSSPHNHLMARDTTTVPQASGEQLRRNAILQDWQNVGLSADIMRPSNAALMDQSPAFDNSDDLQQQSYCCR